MFVSINMDDLQFVHKHADHETVSALAWLEMPGQSVTIENTDREFFLAKLTGLDLRMLYKNTTGLDITGTDHIVVREMLATLIETKLKTTFAHLAEVEAQIAEVEDDLYKGIPWSYALGSRKPAKQEDLFHLHCKPLDAGEATEAAVRAPQRRKVRSATPTAAASAPALQRPRAAAMRMSSVRPTIWAVADEMWEAAGKPTDKEVVLALRKEMMARLETEKSIKRTSSSNELGNWMKSRIV
jgi:hypothetical protein